MATTPSHDPRPAPLQPGQPAARRCCSVGPTSRQALADLTGLSAGTVGTVVADLLEEGSAGGGGLRGVERRATSNDPADVAAERAISVGVDLGERGLRVEAFDLAWQRRAEVVVDLNARGAEAGDDRERIAGAVADVMDRAAMPDAQLLGVGVSVPGVVERSADARIYAPAFGWDGIPFGRLLRRVIPGKVLVDNGAKTMGQAELWFGAGRGASDAIVALLGIGVGAAVFTEGRLYRGSRSSAGEWGHAPIVVDGEPCRCGSLGCLEAYIGESALAASLGRPRGHETSEAVPDPVRIQELFARGRANRPRLPSPADFARYLGAGLATLINLFNPERIVLAGSVGLRVTPAVLEDVRTAAQRYSLRQPFESVAWSRDSSVTTRSPWARRPSSSTSSWHVASSCPPPGARNPRAHAGTADASRTPAPDSAESAHERSRPAIGAPRPANRTSPSLPAEGSCGARPPPPTRSRAASPRVDGAVHLGHLRPHARQDRCTATPATSPATTFTAGPRTSALIADLGLSAYRLSVSWPRLQPAGRAG